MAFQPQFHCFYKKAEYLFSFHRHLNCQKGMACMPHTICHPSYLLKQCFDIQICQKTHLDRYQKNTTAPLQLCFYALDKSFQHNQNHKNKTLDFHSKQSQPHQKMSNLVCFASKNRLFSPKFCQKEKLQQIGRNLQYNQNKQAIKEKPTTFSHKNCWQ